LNPGISLHIKGAASVRRKEAHEKRYEDEQVVMVVVGGLLHEVHPGPEQRKGRHAETVPVPQGDAYTEQAHEDKIAVHPNARERLQPIESDKCEGKLGGNQGTANPSCGNGPKAFQADQYPEKYPKSDQWAVIDPFK
jgi:hypothetical protein